MLLIIAREEILSYHQFIPTSRMSRYMLTYVCTVVAGLGYIMMSRKGNISGLMEPILITRIGVPGSQLLPSFK